MTELSEPADAAVDEPEAEVRTFLIADVRGYTRFTQERGDEAAAHLAARFADLTREGVEGHGGRLTELRGDEALAVFTSARAALRAAVDLQRRYAAEAELPLEAGIGLDAGEAVPVEGGYRGGALNLAARLCDLAAPGEVLATEAVVHLARRLRGLEYVERGTVQLKGFTEPVKIMQVTPSPSSAPAPLPGEGEPAEADQTLPIGGFLGALPEGRLVAREEELGRIRAEMDAVQRSAGRLLLLPGEAGVGKTRLAQEVTLEARNRGFLMAAGSCYEQRQAAPFYPFAEALSALYSACSPEIQTEVARHWPHLGRLLPHAAIPVPPPLTDGLEEQERLFRAVTDFLQAVAAASPLILAFDDLHWADGSSLDLLRHLARHTRASRVLILGTYRDTELDREHPLEATLLELHRQQLVMLVPVRRLDEGGTARLIAQAVGATDVPADLVELLYRRTEGNPFFVQELVRSLVEGGELYRQNGHWRGREIQEPSVPVRVRAVIEQRLSRLSEPVREVLREASVLGQTFSFDDLRELRRTVATAREAGPSLEEEIEEALERATAAGLVREADRERYAFNHTLTQQVLYEDLSGRRRRRLHLAAVQALEGEEGREAELAWHLLQADERERALPHAILAGNAAEGIFAHSEAERLYRMALRIAWEIEPTTGSRTMRLEAETLEKLGVVLRTTGRYEEALEVLEQAARAYQEAGDGEGERRAVASIGAVHAYMGRIDEGIARLLAVLGGAAQRRSPGLALPYVSLAQLFIAGGRYKEGLATAERARELAAAAGDRRILAEAEVRRGEALAALGRHVEARGALEEVVRAAEEGDLGTLVRALGGVGVISVAAGEFTQARRYHERALELAERLGDPRGLALTLLALGEDLFLLGEWDAARAALLRARESASSIDVPGLLALVQAWLGRLSVARGAWEEAERHLEEAGGPEDGEALRLARHVMAERDLLRGRPLTADLEEYLEPQETEALLLLARSALERGDADGAEEPALRAFARAAAAHHRVSVAEALWVQGMVRSRQGRGEEPRRLFEGALALARGMPHPYLEARVLYEWGKTRPAHGERQEAREALREALTGFERLGARPYLERTQQLAALLTEEA